MTNQVRILRKRLKVKISQLFDVNLRKNINASYGLILWSKCHIWLYFPRSELPRVCFNTFLEVKPLEKYKKIIRLKSVIDHTTAIKKLKLLKTYPFTMRANVRSLACVFPHVNHDTSRMWEALQKWQEYIIRIMNFLTLKMLLLYHRQCTDTVFPLYGSSCGS